MRLDSRRASGLFLLLALLGWWQMSAMWRVNSPNWPTVVVILQALVSGLKSGEILEVFGSSVWRMVVGYAAGSLVGVAIGLLMARQRWIHAALTR